MKFRGLNTEQRLILNFLYELRNTVMIPPDPRLSLSGIAKVLCLERNLVTGNLKELKERSLILPFRVGRKKYYKITLAGIYEIEKRTTFVIEGELSTSKIGIKGIREKVAGQHTHA